jgi:hypothetical protein
MSGSQYDDLADRVEEAVRAYVLKRMPPDPSGELATEDFRGLLHIYANWSGRHPSPRPRSVQRSREMTASAEAERFATEIAELVRKMEAGEDLKPHLSRAVDTAFLSTQERAALPRSQREKDLDRMLAELGHPPSTPLQPCRDRRICGARQRAVVRSDRPGRCLPGGHLYPSRLAASGPRADHRPQLARVEDKPWEPKIDESARETAYHFRKKAVTRTFDWAR